MDEANNDKYCTWIHQPGHKKAGQRCEGFKVVGAEFCSGHVEGGVDKMIAGRNRRSQAAQELQNTYFELKTRQDVQNALEKIVNGVLSGTVKRDKGQLLAVFLPLAYKIAKELEGFVPTGKGVTLKMVQETKSLSVEMSDEQMDAYLNGNDKIKIQILEELESAGKLSVAKRKDEPVLDAVLTAEDKDIKINAKELAKISMDTDVPQTAEQMRGLFGRTLADKPAQQDGPDMTGFGDLFDEGNLPEGMEPIQHQWKGAYEKQDNGLAALWFTCQICGKRAKNVNKEICKDPLDG